MRVAIVQEHVDVRRGGAETSTLETARHLAALGLEVTVVCSGGDEATKRRSDGGHNSGWPAALGVAETNTRVTPTDQRNTPPIPSFQLIDTGGGSRAARAVRFVSEADRYCRAQGFDIVHAITPCFSCNVYQPRGGTYVETVNRSVARARTSLGRLIKRIGRRFNRRQRLLLLAERELLGGRNPPFVAAVSEYVSRQVRTAFPAYPRERLRVIFNGVAVEPLEEQAARRERTSMRQQLGADSETGLLLFVAHNFKLKGLGELIRAMALQERAIQSPTPEGVGHPERVGHARSEPGAPAVGTSSSEAPLRSHFGQAPRHSDGEVGSSAHVLAVVGRDNPARYRQLARRLGIADRVRFLGARNDMRALYAAADVLVHPTWYDPCSRVVLEALCCGLPVVTTRFNGAAEVIEDGRHGVVVDSPRDAAALAAAIERCLQPDLRATCRADASQMRERLSMVRNAEGLTALYGEVVHG